jgi:hypothetical protein
MTIQTDNLSAPQPVIAAAPGSSKEVASIDNLAFNDRTSKLSLTQKLNAFDPKVHGGELMVDDSVGVEFGARA